MSDMRRGPVALAKHFDSAAAEEHWLSEWGRLNFHAADGSFRVAAVEFAASVEA